MKLQAKNGKLEGSNFSFCEDISYKDASRCKNKKIKFYDVCKKNHLVLILCFNKMSVFTPHFAVSNFYPTSQYVSIHIASESQGTPNRQYC